MRYSRIRTASALCLALAASAVVHGITRGAPATQSTAQAFRSLVGGDLGQVNARDGDNGFLAEYYRSPDLSGAPVSNRLEPAANFSGRSVPPIPGFEASPGPYSVRWTGTVTPARTATYTFGLRGVSAGARLLIDGKPVVTLDAGSKDLASRRVASLDLIADKSYELVVELRNPDSTSRLVTEWSAGADAASGPAARVAPPEVRVGPAEGARIGAPAALENANYRLDSGADGSFTVTEKATGARAVFQPHFFVVRQTAKIDRANGKFVGTPPVGTTNYKVPAWNKETDYFHALGSRARLVPTSVTASGAQLDWAYTAQGDYTLTARVTLPADGTEPKLTFALKAAAAGQYSVGFAGAPAKSAEATDWIWQPLIWTEKRFPNQSYLSEEYQCPIPAALVGMDGVAVGVAADGAEMPFRMPTRLNSRFGVTVRNAAGDAQPLLFAPVMGGAESAQAAGSTYEFALRLVVRKGDWYGAYRHLARSLYNFADVRENGLCSLNTTIENMADYLLMPQFSYWYAEHKTWGYQNDAAGSGRQESSANGLSLAMVLDDRRILDEIAFPSLEYFLSRSTRTIRIAGADPRNYMGGPIQMAFTDLVAAYNLTGDRSTAIREMLLKAFPNPIDKGRKGTVASLKANMLHALARYRLTRDAADLTAARAAADRYIAERIDKPSPTFTDDIGSSFWNELGPYWDVLYELYNATGDKRYLDAAKDGIREFAGFINLVPPIPPGDFVANPGGVYNNQPVPEEVVPAWRVAANGLAAECAGTASSHRGVFMAPYASYFARIALDSGDDFLRDIARSSTIGRYANYPSYAYRNGYSTVYEKPGYPLRSFEEIKKFTSAHYNHPLPMTLFLVDYLVGETYYRSKGAIDFPSAYTNTGAYFKTKLFGHAPGRFYDDSGVWLWMPRKLVTFDSIQVNYLAGHGNGRLYLALSNASDKPVTTTLAIDPRLAEAGGAHNARVWIDNKVAAPVTVTDGRVTVTLPPKGLVALAIDGVKVSPQVVPSGLAKAAPLPPSSYQEAATPAGTARAFVLSIGPDLSRAYVYLDSDAKSLEKATLTYTLSGEPRTLTDDSYPYEFSIPLPPAAGSPAAMSLRLTLTPKTGAAVQTPEIALPLR